MCDRWAEQARPYKNVTHHVRGKLGRSMLRPYIIVIVLAPKYSRTT